jgi:hypothetical protein
MQDLFRRHAAGKHFKDMAHRDSHAANSSPPHRSDLIVIRPMCM